jgi:hypothetical protein
LILKGLPPQTANKFSQSLTNLKGRTVQQLVTTLTTNQQPEPQPNQQNTKLNNHVEEECTSNFSLLLTEHKQRKILKIKNSTFS